LACELRIFIALHSIDKHHQSLAHQVIHLLHDSIARAAQHDPYHIAFRYMGQEISYGALLAQSNQLAHQIAECGIAKGDRVGIFLDRSLETAVAVYGILSAGAVFVPLDTLAPPARIRMLIEDCGIRCLVSRPAQSRGLKAIFEQNTCVDFVIGVSDILPVSTISWDVVATFRGDRSPVVDIESDDLAYIMYTSGSTGAPKGIMHTHFSGLNYARLSADLYGLVPQDRIGNHSPLHFDISTMGYLTGPYVGATTVIIPEAHTKMPASLSKLIETERLTVWYSVPLALVQLLERGVLEERDMSALRWVLFGGEPFPPKYLAALMARWTWARFSNVYGPAEVNQCTFHHLEVAPEIGGRVPLGHAWDETDILIIDKKGNTVEAGVAGELIVSTPTMMKGYWRQPDLTQNAMLFRKNASGQTMRYYRTGDLASCDTNETLDFLGRIDRQIKTRGYRVELNEVESALVRHELVKEAAVFAPDNGDGIVHIRAVVVMRKAGASVTYLLDEITKTIPWYAIPEKISEVEYLARTNAGKIDYKYYAKLASNEKNS
jgi:amino acid adenylation domain-containing protein